MYWGAYVLSGPMETLTVCSALLSRDPHCVQGGTECMAALYMRPHCIGGPLR